MTTSQIDNEPHDAIVDRRSSTQSRSARPLRALAVGILCVLATIVASGCGDVALEGDVQSADDPRQDPFQRAELMLESHRVDDAYDIYREVLDDEPDNGDAAAGVAITRLLLMAEMNEVTELLIEHLGASGGIDANELLYAGEGYLYWASRGVRWAEDHQDYEGIRNLVADELPWDSQRLESVADFVDGLDDPAGQGLRQLVTVANRLSNIESDLETALDDSDFVRLYVPGAVFHDDSLTLRIGRSELAIARAAISMLRSAVYFVTAYEHDWTLETAFGHWRHDPPTDHSRYTPGYEPVDYTVEVFDEYLFRDIDSPGQLSASKDRLRETVDHLRDAIRFGIEEPTSTTLQWDDVDEADAEGVDELLEAIGDALDGPTELPYANPETTLDLTPLFDDDGRILDDSYDWFIRRAETEDEDGDDQQLQGFERWKLNERAVEQFLYRDVFDPVPRNQDLAIEAGPDGDLKAFGNALYGDYWDNVEDVFLTTR